MHQRTGSLRELCQELSEKEKNTTRQNAPKRSRACQALLRNCHQSPVGKNQKPKVQKKHAEGAEGCTQFKRHCGYRCDLRASRATFDLLTRLSDARLSWANVARNARRHRLAFVGDERPVDEAVLRHVHLAKGRTGRTGHSPFT